MITYSKINMQIQICRYLLFCLWLLQASSTSPLWWHLCKLHSEKKKKVVKTQLSLSKCAWMGYVKRAELTKSWHCQHTLQHTHVHTHTLGSHQCVLSMPPLLLLSRHFVKAVCWSEIHLEARSWPGDERGAADFHGGCVSLCWSSPKAHIEPYHF